MSTELKALSPAGDSNGSLIMIPLSFSLLDVDPFQEAECPFIVKDGPNIGNGTTSS